MVVECTPSSETNKAKPGRDRKQPWGKHSHQARQQQEWSGVEGWSIVWINESTKKPEEGQIAQEAEGAQAIQRWVKDTGKTNEAEEPQQAYIAGNTVKEPEQLRSWHRVPPGPLPNRWRRAVLSWQTDLLYPSIDPRRRIGRTESNTPSDALFTRVGCEA
jgi:hypothetical protein